MAAGILSLAAFYSTKSSSKYRFSLNQTN